MLFNTLDFALFFPIVFILYWFIKNTNLKLQNILLLVASYYFYACWDWRFLFLLLFSTVLDYITGIIIKESKSGRNRKFWFWLSISINLGFLGVFKYYNFFASSLVESFSFIGIHISIYTLNVVLPVGISFYTFHGLSYVIDIYKKRIEPERNFVDYSLFVSFFPLLVAGPIERATHLLPQLKKPRIFNYLQAVSGLKQILWGLFKKVVIADSCAEYADLIFNNYTDYSGSTLVLGAFFFTIQIYGDFSGYSDIALGTARLLGIDLIRNFSFPYFSRDISEFWRRWHISLSTWFRDYLYIPLGGSKGSMWMKVRNTFIIFIVSGFWHGANWTFIAWGVLNAVYFMPLLLRQNNRNHLDIIAQGRLFPKFKDFSSMIITFGLVAFSWIFFRSPNLSTAFNYIHNMLAGLTYKWGYGQTYDLINKNIDYRLFIIIMIFIIFEWLGREEQHVLYKLGNSWYRPIRYLLYYGIIFLVLLYGGKEQQFIYFQF